jgi:hypothetical protein
MADEAAALQRIAALPARMDGLDTLIAANEMRVDQQMAALDGRVAAAKAPVDALASRLAEMEAGLACAELPRLAALPARVDGLETEIAESQLRADQQMAAIDGRVTAAKAPVDALAARLDDVEAGFACAAPHIAKAASVEALLRDVHVAVMGNDQAVGLVKMVNDLHAAVLGEGGIRDEVAAMRQSIDEDLPRMIEMLRDAVGADMAVLRNSHAAIKMEVAQAVAQMHAAVKASAHYSFQIAQHMAAMQGGAPPAPPPPSCIGGAPPPAFAPPPPMSSSDSQLLAHSDFAFMGAPRDVDAP